MRPLATSQTLKINALTRIFRSIETTNFKERTKHTAEIALGNHSLACFCLYLFSLKALVGLYREQFHSEARLFMSNTTPSEVLTETTTNHPTMRIESNGRSSKLHSPIPTTFELNIKPFLRWAGGKKWLLPFCFKLLEDIEFNQYHEPFVGSGTLFFALPKAHKSFLSDINMGLITTYEEIKKNPHDVLQKFGKMKNEREEYYRIRRQKYQSATSKAAQFLYLNQTSYNGLYRVNSSGEYNVPYGNRKLWNYDTQRVYDASMKLSVCDATLRCCDFEEALLDVAENDLVFLDPPYVVSNGRENGFCEYNEKIFSLEDQQKLSCCIDQIKARNAYYILTNAHHPKILEIFEKGDVIHEIERSSCIGGRNAKRGKVKEYVFTNIRKER